MAGASGEYVKVYLYLLRHQQEEVSIGQIADALNHTEADVQRALAYWQRAGVLGTEVGEEAQRSFQEMPGQQISPVSASTESLAGAGSFAPSAKTAAREAAHLYCPAVFKQAAHTDGLPDSWKSLFESGIFRGIAGIPD